MEASKDLYRVGELCGVSKQENGRVNPTDIHRAIPIG